MSKEEEKTLILDLLIDDDGGKTKNPNTMLILNSIKEETELVHYIA